MPYRMGLCITIRRPRYGYLAITFPRLEYLTLGQWPCGVNAYPACATAPLLFFSPPPIPRTRNTQTSSFPRRICCRTHWPRWTTLDPMASTDYLSGSPKNRLQGSAPFVQVLQARIDSDDSGCCFFALHAIRMFYTLALSGSCYEGSRGY